MTNAHSKYKICEENYPIPTLTRKEMTRYLKLGGDGCPVGGGKRYMRQAWTLKWNWDLNDFEAVNYKGGIDHEVNAKREEIWEQIQLCRRMAGFS